VTFDSLSAIRKKWSESQVQLLNAPEAPKAYSSFDAMQDVLPLLLLCGQQATEDLSSGARSVAFSKLTNLGLIIVLSACVACGGAGALVLSAGSISTLGRVAGFGGLVGVGVYGREATRQLSALDAEYRALLYSYAQSMGACMEQQRVDQASLEKVIHQLYERKFKNAAHKTIKADEHWKSYFPVAPLSLVSDGGLRERTLRALECISRLCRMRTLLGEELAIGVVGAGKVGKSSAVRSLFGFDSHPSNHVRTTDLKAFPVTGLQRRFAVFDFPHVTSQIESVRHCLMCNHSLVHGVLVVLDALQSGDDVTEKERVLQLVKSLENEGVAALYCFNRADKLIQKAAQNDDNNMQFVSEFNSPEALQQKLEKIARAYDLKVKQCRFTAFSLDYKSSNQKQQLEARLKQLGVLRADDIKRGWLSLLLRNNSFTEEDIHVMQEFQLQPPQPQQPSTASSAAVELADSRAEVAKLQAQLAQLQQQQQQQQHPEAKSKELD